jgi:hypothetical protein
MSRAARFAMVAAALLLGSSAAFAADPPLTKGLSLSAMHAQLLRAGWKPVETGLRWNDGDLQHKSGGAGMIYRAGFHAVHMCSGTGTNPCIFNYAKAGKCLRIVTLGEYVPPEAEPHVDNWTFTCPDKE